MKIRARLETACRVALAGIILSACGPEPPRRVIVIAVDTLAAGHLGTYGATPSPSPLIDARAERGIVFERAFASSPWTLPSFGSLLTGLDPGHHEAGIILRNHPDRAKDRTRVGPRSRLELNPEVSTLAERLSVAGVTTIALVQSPNLDPAFGLDRGFDFYEHQKADNDRIVTADAAVDRALETLDDHRDVPLFLLVHLFDPHLDYHAPPPFAGSLARTDPESGADSEPRTLGAELSLPVTGVQRLRRNSRSLTAEHKRFIRAAYDEEIAFVDREIERFFAGLESRGLDKDSVVILTSDHGEEFFEHGGFEHGHSLYNEVLHIPLVVWQPGVRPERRSAPVSHVDVAPMILELMGTEIPPDLDGQSALRVTASDRLLIAEGTLIGSEKQMAIRWPHKLIRESRSGRVQLFDLDADPRESVGIVDSPLTRTLAAALAERIGAPDPSKLSAPARLDSNTVEDLRALGYVE